jgi:hypothetical protein
MGLIGVLSNHDLQGSLGRLVEKLAAVRARGEPRRQVVVCGQQPRRPGWGDVDVIGRGGRRWTPMWLGLGVWGPRLGVPSPACWFYTTATKAGV